MEKNFSIGDAVSFSWDVMKTNLGFWLPTVLIFWVAGSIPAGIQSMSIYMSDAAGAIWMALFGLVSFAIGIFVHIAQVNVSLKFCSGETADFPDLIAKYQKFLDVLLGTILYGLLVTAGFILLIIPGIYWAVRYQFFAYLIIDQDMGPVDAIKRSGQLTRGVWWHVFGLGWTLFGIYLLGLLACCVGLLFAVPVMAVTTAYVYRTLLAATPGEMPVPAPELQPQPPEALPPAQ